MNKLLYTSIVATLTLATSTVHASADLCEATTITCTQQCAPTGLRGETRCYQICPIIYSDAVRNAQQAH